MRRLFVVLAAIASTTTAAFCQDIPGNAADLQFDAFVNSFDLENTTLEFTYKAGKHEGSSVGFHVSQPGHRKAGTFSPLNRSNNLESEVVSYRLARFLGISNIYNPVTYYKLGPRASGRFKVMLRQRQESDPDRRANHDSAAAELNAHPGWIQGIYRFRPRGNRYVALSLATSEGHLNQSHPLAGFIRANGPLPTEKPMSLAGVRGQRLGFPKPSEKESELARQLSNILLIDQLMGQWDRFFNNLEAVGDVSGRLQFLARDNGGATVDDWEWHDLYERWLSRYDRGVIDRLRNLSAFLHGKDAQFSGFDSVETWKVAVGFSKDGSFNTFKRKLERLIEKRLPELERQYGARTYFTSAPRA